MADYPQFIGTKLDVCIRVTMLTNPVLLEGCRLLLSAVHSMLSSLVLQCDGIRVLTVLLCRLCLENYAIRKAQKFCK